jgi:nitroreductase
MRRRGIVVKLALFRKARRLGSAMTNRPFRDGFTGWAKTANERGQRPFVRTMTSQTLELLLRRRSAPPQTLAAPGPTADELETLLRAASRVPDHGKLAPWRFVLFEGAARERAGEIAARLAAADNPGADEARLAVERGRFTRAPVVVAVVSRAGPHVKIPEWEQVLSAGAVCMNLTLAANALGYKSAWITEWCAYDRRFCAAIGLADHEKIAGFIHIGRPSAVIEDRVRPALDAIVTRF